MRSIVLKAPITWYVVKAVKIAEDKGGIEEDDIYEIFYELDKREMSPYTFRMNIDRYASRELTIDVGLLESAEFVGGSPLKVLPSGECMLKQYNDPEMELILREVVQKFQNTK